MAEAVKSVLLLDYDSVHRSLSASDPAAAERLAERLAGWVGAIEAGSLFSPRPDTAARRRVLIRRCYADPAVIGEARKTFLSNGFQVIDCPPADGREHNAAAIHMVLDSVDALGHPTEYDEFILLSAGSDLSPLLIRLRAHNRTTAIYSSDGTADSYKAIADSLIEEPQFIAALLSEAEPDVEEEGKQEEEKHPPPDRSAIEALARKVSAATNVPLFAPRTFAELFRQLVEEIAKNGYHFQSTAENVATRMADGGRKVSRRQVVFVVKGLALKGHVFSTGDTPERLADVFREQALYLAENAGLELDDTEKRVLSAWIVGQVAPVPGGNGENGESRTPVESSHAEKTEETDKTDDAQSNRIARRRPTGSTEVSKPREEAKSTEAKSAEAKPKPIEEKKPRDEPKPREATKSAVTSEKPSEQSKTTAERARPEASRSPAKLAASAEPAEQASAESSPAAAQKPAAPSAAAAIMSSSRAAPTPSKPAATPLSKAASRPPEAGGDDDSGKDTVESSILAAIAQAVDVLVEDSGAKPKTPAKPNQAKAEETETQPAEADEDHEEVGQDESDDIGDEIQRIIASYNRNRNKDEDQEG